MFTHNLIRKKDCMALPSRFDVCTVEATGCCTLDEYSGVKTESTVGDTDDDDFVPGPKYPVRTFTFSGRSCSAQEEDTVSEGPEAAAPTSFAVELLAYEALPPDEAVALLSGDDRTGMKGWVRPDGALDGLWEPVVQERPARLCVNGRCSDH